jgi:hypothetical protein
MTGSRSCIDQRSDAHAGVEGHRQACAPHRAFIVGLFQPGVRMYEVKNTGWRYDLGFLLGVLVMLGGGGSQTRVCY